MTEQRKAGHAGGNATSVLGRGRAIMLVVMLGWSAPALAQSLPDLTIEELMKLDAGQVFGAISVASSCFRSRRIPAVLFMSCGRLGNRLEPLGGAVVRHVSHVS